jgi:hypothetical protein
VGLQSGAKGFPESVEFEFQSHFSQVVRGKWDRRHLNLMEYPLL